MADKLLGTGHLGITNYRPLFNRPVYGTVPLGARAGAPGSRRPRRPSPVVVPPHEYPYPFNLVTDYYSPPRKRKSPTRYKPKYKRKCCRWYRGKKYCSPRFCPKKYYW